MSGRVRFLLAGLCGLVIVLQALGNIFLPPVLPHRIAAALRDLATAALLALVTTSGRFQRYVPEATPESLAAIRILTCAVVLGSVLWEDLASTALIPADVGSLTGAMWVFAALPAGFQSFAQNAAVLQLFKWVTAALLFLGVLGWGTRMVLPLAAVCALIFGGMLRHYSYFWHQGIVPLYLLMVLSWTPCGDGWSLDRVFRSAVARPVPAAGRGTPIYGWSQYACWVVIALPYVESGLSKLRYAGWFWWDPVSIRAFSYRDTLRVQGAAGSFLPGFSLHLAHVPDVVFALLGICALLIELLYGLILFSRTARRILPAAAFLMHIGIFVLQKLFFYDLLLVQLVFLDVTTVGNAATQICRRVANRLDFARRGRERKSVHAGHPVAIHETVRFRLAWPLAVSGIMAVLLISWAHGVESYPLTTWKMYAKHASHAEYTHVYAHYESGAVSRAYFADAIGALTGSRARTYSQMCFDPAHRPRCETFLGAVAAAYNRQTRSAGRVTQFEVKSWSWDFRAYPLEPGRAALTDLFRFDVPRSAAAHR